jgi:iron complex transport system substrate-binding protein
MPPRQRPRPLFSLFLAGFAGLWGFACDRDAATSGTATAPATQSVARPSVASLSPGATDLLIGMGAADHLVAVSNWDGENPQTRGLPRVGDYRSIDRERLSELRPDVVVVQWRADKLPPGTAEFVSSLGARLVNIQIVTLEDVFTATRDLGNAIGAPGRARAASDTLRAELDAVKRSVAGRAPVRVFVARAENGLDSVGGGNFIDDVLTIAGGANVLTGGHNSFPTVDREQLVRLDPDVILHLLPGATPQIVGRARQSWADLPELRAVKTGRVYLLDEYFVLQPSYRLGETARLFAERLHGVGPATDASHGKAKHRDHRDTESTEKTKKGSLLPTKLSSSTSSLCSRCLCDLCVNLPPDEPAHAASAERLR